MKMIVIILLSSIILIFSATTTYADTFMPPEPFEIWSSDGETVFRWNPGTEENWSFGGTAEAGVYRNNVLLYLVENLPTLGAHEGEFLFSDDFRYFVFTPQVGQVMALGFFEEGVLLRAYRIDELVRDMNVVTYSVTTAMWENWQARNFDATNNTLTIVTRDNITYVFDITTGEIIYDTAGDLPFLSNIISLLSEQVIPLWAQGAVENNASSWAQESIARADELGLLPDSFRSRYNRNTTRAEFALIAITLYEHFNQPITGRITFNDTTDTHVEKAAYLGIVTGIGDNLFDPNAPITREQAAVMLDRLIFFFGYDSHNVAPRFDDSREISPWAFLSVGHIQARGIIGGIGDNLFAPQSFYTIEQSIVTIMRIFDML